MSTPTIKAASAPSPSPLLLQSIASSDVDTLRLVLTTMCKDSIECSNEASKHLLVRVADLVPYIEGPPPDIYRGPNEVKPTTGTGTKRRKINPSVADKLISRYETCGTCKGRFDVTLNSMWACRTHDGFLEVNDDDDQWADVDDDEFDRVNPETDWRRDEFPDMFEWSCCGENADAEPCVVSRHVLAKESKTTSSLCLFEKNDLRYSAGI